MTVFGLRKLSIGIIVNLMIWFLINLVLIIDFKVYYLWSKIRISQFSIKDGQKECNYCKVKFLLNISVKLSK